jgi:hypothetical protein
MKKLLGGVSVNLSRRQRNEYRRNKLKFMVGLFLNVVLVIGLIAVIFVGKSR